MRNVPKFESSRKVSSIVVKERRLLTAILVIGCLLRVLGEMGVGCCLGLYCSRNIMA
jgi:hypothetical protein